MEPDDLLDDLLPAGDETPKRKRKKGRGSATPRIDLDLKLIEVLSEAGCPIREIAAMLQRSGLKVSMRTITRRMTDPEYKAARDRGTLVGHAKLRSNMVQLSRMRNSGGVQMSMFLAKNWLGMAEKSEIAGRIDSTIEMVSPQERFLARMDRGANRIDRRVHQLLERIRADVAAGTVVAGGTNDGAAAGAAPGSIAGPKPARP